ncbi:right-handed parallel beta-helix repeat-containing protein [Formosa algae]|uniref:Parallel beta-helix repeat protein n=1 Tax=Formosa algae TaxID=225843 RepID=A0A9X0YLB7_9FLAO|nr:right-handed parallel beta-helix repeat-containing protein [Formosa algae]MBP1840073.1 parallel beta-helix repeat protein [Formosa algae]MDQ0335673.1 parallel beta-helix repeat protein [Formosa algae]OEI78740.1 peptidase [Formosa algae]
MKKYLIIVLACITASCNGIAQSETDNKADFYVSTEGSDNWSGTLEKPNAKGTDGPFATLEQARDAVRLLKKSKPIDIKVLIREGVYPLKETVVFGLEDSGEDESIITYAAYPGETPVFSSGQEINDWKKVTTNLPGLPKEAEGKVFVADVSDKFLTLYDDEGMLPRAQSKEYKPLNTSTRNELHFSEGELKNWSNVEDVEILVRPTRDWIVNMLPLASVDEEKGIATTAVEATYEMQRKGYWVENVLEVLDEPGEWVLNTKEGKVYLWPRNNSAIIAPRLLELIRVEGQIDFDGPTDIPVRNIHFSGLTFKHAERYTLTKDDAGLQHDWDMLDKNNAMLRLRGTEHCVIEKCHFLYGGSGAVRVDLYGQNNTISNNHIEYMGGGGILLCGYGPGTKDVNKKNTVYNNNIHHVGEIYWQSPGIFLWNSGENKVANNLIHDTNYCGLIVSGCVIRFFKHSDIREQYRAIRWHEIGELPDELTPDVVRPYWHSKNNIIEYNEIHNVMNKLGDGNGIYIRASGPGNIIRRNYIHDLVAETGKQSGIRTDGGQMDTQISENIIYKCRSQGMILKLNNRFENNIIAEIFEPRQVYLKIVEGPMEGASNKKNIFYSLSKESTFISQPPPGKGLVGEDSRGRIPATMKDVDSDFNIYYNKADNSIAEKTLKSLQAEDYSDQHSVATDPMFIDIEHGDFRFQPNSPALKMGIIPIEVSEIGLRTID